MRRINMSRYNYVVYGDDMLGEDGEYYYVSAREVAEKYGVLLGRCFLVNDEFLMKSLGITIPKDLPVLRPQYNPEDYDLSKVEGIAKVRQVKLKDGRVESFYVTGQMNPCGCGSNLFHKENDGKHTYGVCNSCDKDIYTYEVRLEFDEWEYKIN